ncbi:MAG: SUMF1/EgtB/PvdO family nonheme iron enzyme, partial [Thermoanaerobaculia bacterium]
TYNAPVLDAIAWYGGNSGVDFELEDGWDSSDWPEKQYPHVFAGTRPVAKKAPNPWGLYDMLGNVHEWCSDFWADSYEGAEIVDPSGPEKGSSRVIRGGSWISVARDVRAAYRDRYDPGYRDDGLGFRLARGPEGEAW